MDFRSRFGLHTTPFTRELPTKKRFRMEQFDEALDGLRGAVDSRQSGAIIAPAGTGKTVLVRTLREELPEVGYDVRYIKTTNLSRRDMCREVAMAIQCQPVGNYPALVRRVQDRFQNALSTDGLRPVVIADDAHEMRPETLGLIKLLTNYDMDSRLVVSVILVGQPPLRALLQRPDLEDVAKRLVHYAELRLLSRDEARQYVEHRCSIAGATRTLFDELAFEALYELSRGNLRALDRLALKALSVAGRADQEVVDNTHVLEARRTLWP